MDAEDEEGKKHSWVLVGKKKTEENDERGPC